MLFLIPGLSLSGNNNTQECCSSWLSHCSVSAAWQIVSHFLGISLICISIQSLSFNFKLVFISIMICEWIPQRWTNTTPSLEMWDVGVVVPPSPLQEKEGSQQSGSGNTTTLTLLGQCSPLPCPFVSRVGTYEGETCEILSVSQFAFVLCPSCSIQLRYGFLWSTMVGRAVGSPMEMELLEDERIIQVSGASVWRLFYFWQSSHIAL